MIADVYPHRSGVIRSPLGPVPGARIAMRYQVECDSGPFCCDSPAGAVDLLANSPSGLRAALREAGWQVRATAPGDWDHRCPACNWDGAA